MTDAGVAEAISDEVDAALETPASEALEGCPVGAIRTE